MLQKFCKWLLFDHLGWKEEYTIERRDKCIIAVAPHTSNWDFLLGECYYAALGRRARFLMKREWFFWPLGCVLKRMGGIPVDRSRGNNMVVKTAAIFRQYDELNIVITPEGTRKRIEKWKRGFYYIAELAQVPVVLGFIDFKTRRCGYGPCFIPSGDFDKDWPMIEDFYRGMQGKTPGRFNLE